MSRPRLGQGVDPHSLLSSLNCTRTAEQAFHDFLWTNQPHIRHPRESSRCSLALDKSLWPLSPQQADSTQLRSPAYWAWPREWGDSRKQLKEQGQKSSARASTGSHRRAHRHPLSIFRFGRRSFWLQIGFVRRLCDNGAMTLYLVGLGVAASVWLGGASQVILATAAGNTCPASFTLAKGACVPQTARQGSVVCRYPEGRCECRRTPGCSGVPRPPAEPAWTCSRPRTDGCPPDAPAADTPCAVNRTVSCSYGACASITFACVARKWTMTAANGPPPVSQNRAARTFGWKSCTPPNHFECTPRSQGFAPPRGETVPLVCGCAPTCAGLTLIAREANGFWPDGSRKGLFQCAVGGIPGAKPDDRR